MLRELKGTVADVTWLLPREGRAQAQIGDRTHSSGSLTDTQDMMPRKSVWCIRTDLRVEVGLCAEGLRVSIVSCILQR